MMVSSTGSQADCVAIPLFSSSFVSNLHGIKPLGLSDFQPIPQIAVANYCIRRLTHDAGRR
jgi:hypothetical protein